MSDVTETTASVWHKRPDLPVAFLGVGITLLLAGGGWIWHLSGQASQTDSLERRVTVLEASETTRDSKIASMSERLSRMEPMLEYMVSRMRDLQK